MAIFPCKFCKKQFSRKDNVSRHVANIHKKKRVFCKLCGKTLNRSDNLLKHMKAFHADSGPCVPNNIKIPDKTDKGVQVDILLERTSEECNCNRELYDVKCEGYIKIPVKTDKGVQVDVLFESNSEETNCNREACDVKHEEKVDISSEKIQITGGTKEENHLKNENAMTTVDVKLFYNL